MVVSRDPICRGLPIEWEIAVNELAAGSISDSLEKHGTFSQHCDDSLLWNQ